MTRWLALATLFTVACHRPIGTVEHEPLRADPARLLLRAYVGHELRDTVSVFNPDRARVDATATVSGPFEVAPLELSLDSAESVALEVRFAPAGVGTFTGELVLTDSLGGVTRVALEGAALAVPACAASGVCRQAQFDTVGEACVESNRPDDTSCAPELSCYASASCQGGVCRGVLSAACDDGDACTVDGCGVEGCLHVPRECPVSDPCLVATCDPVSGCGTSPVTDGTSCGPSRCEDAYICLGGRCALTPRPNAQTDCRYTDVAPARSGGCGLTVGGDVKCWGVMQGPRLLPALHGILPGSLDAEAFACGLRAGGTVSCVLFNGLPRALPPDPVPFTRPALDVQTSDDRVCARLDDESLECWQAGSDAGAVRLFDAGSVRAWSVAGPCVVLPDGGAPCRSTPQVFPPQLAMTTVAMTLGGPVGLTTGGAVWCGTSLCGPDAGATMLGGTHDQVCWVVDAGSVGCTRVQGNNPLMGETLPGPISLLSRTTQGQLCALVNGEPWCAGANPFSALGEYSVTPLEVSTLPMGARALDVPDFGVTVIVVDGGLRRLGSGAHFVSLPAGVEPVQLSHVDGSLQGEWSFVTRDGGVWLGAGGQLRHPVALPGPASRVSGVRAMAAGHAWELTTGDDLGPALSISRRLVLRPDGGGIDVPVALTQISDQSRHDHGCGLTPAGGAVCWNRPGDGGVELNPIVGLRPGATLITSDHGYGGVGCVLIPPSGVQCWGAPGESLPAGARAPPTRYTAVDVVVGEPIVSLSTTYRHSCAVTRSGALACWGDNTGAPFGFEPLMYSPRFVRVPW
ncbi:MAG: hypothetical protein JNK82_02675 [Myxococcaceae bacterium]|nr:hypothetical protein [Myxococcaceae bacterium]